LIASAEYFLCLVRLRSILATFTRRVPVAVTRCRARSRLAAETALGVWRVAVTEWTRQPEARSLPDVVSTTVEAARSLGRA